MDHQNSRAESSRDASSNAEDYFQGIVETVREPLVVLDARLRVRSANPSFYRTFRVTPEETEGHLIYELGNRQWDIPGLRRLLEEVLPQRTHFDDYEVEHEFPNIGRRVMLLNARRINPQDGGAELILLAVEDVTERKRAEDKVRLYAARLERSNRELQDFAQIASHDLQEPLRKIQAFGDRLKAKAGPAFDETALDYLRRMLDAAARMRTLINDLLAFARVETKARPFTEVDLRVIAEDVVGDLETRIEQAGGSVRLGELPVIEADPLQMRQLFQNLIGNALKYHREGVPPVVEVTAQVMKERRHVSRDVSPVAERLCQVSVKDNGIGFDEKYLDRIFTVFQRLHGRGEYEGTGVGLAVCRRIAERHGGSITARSRPGEGATFIVTLPVKQAEGLE